MIRWGNGWCWPGFRCAYRHRVALADQSPSAALSRDPLLRMRAYQLARELVVDSWADAEKLSRHQVTEKISGQLYAAVGSIAANMGEGYSRSSGRDRVRLFEYALGSARESMAWYETAAPVLGAEVARARFDKLEQIRRLLLAAIPRERHRLIRPANS